MKKIVFGFSLLAAFILAYATPVKTQYPIVSFTNVHEIIELYRDGQYDIVKAKLANQGFKVTKSEPDYTLHGTSHEGTFTMEMNEDSPSAQYRAYGWKQTSSWDFKTEKVDGFVINDIGTEMYSASYSKATEERV